LAVSINPRTGGIEAVHDTAHRRNRISQQIAFEDSAQSPDRDAARGYTKMLADNVEVTANNAMAAEITSRGRLVDALQSVVARFEQVTRLQRASRIVDIGVTLSEMGGEMEQDRPRRAMLRWAWRDPPLEIRRDVHGASFVTSRRMIFAPDFLELVETDGRLAILGGGSPWHRLAAENRLDTILPVHSANPQTFHFAVAIDPPGPSINELDAWSLPPLTASVEHLAQDVRAWWLYCRSRNVRFTHIAPLAGGRNGFTARLQEVSGNYVHTRLEAFRPIHAAHRTDWLGNHLVALPVHDGKAELQLAGYQWIQIDVEWET